MSEVRRIQDQLRRAFEGEAWHGDSIIQLLKGVTAEQAAAKPIKGVHSIYEIVSHIAFWETISRRRVEGDEGKVENLEEGWAFPNDGSEAAWQAAIEKLKISNEALRETIGKLSDEQLKEKAAGQIYSIYFMLHGVIQHDLYHAGQIAVLKKALTA
ncbi:MAG: DinB family protein [Acidobacteriota bacterium]